MATTSSTTASATSQLITALGGGSGVDMAALAETLANAQFAAKSDRLTVQSERLQANISAASSLKSMLVNLSASLGERVRTGDLSPQPTLANGAVAKPTLSGTARPRGTFSLEVTTLASAQTLASPAYPAATAPVGAGSLTLRFGTVAGSGFTEDTAHTPVTVTIPTGATLADVAGAINAANAGVAAFVANTAAGAQLVLKGQEGAANGFVLEATETPGEEGLANLAWTPAGDATRLKAAAGDAAFRIDGLAMTAKSNTVTDAIPGLNLKLTATNTGSPTQLSFADPAAAIRSAMQELVGAFNEVVAALNQATNPQTGELAQDAGARGLKRSLAQFGTQVIMPGATGNEPKTLAEIGLSIQRDGTFKLDTGRLNAMLTADPQGVAAMFTNGLYGVFASFDALARRATSTSDPGSLGGSIARYTAQATKLKADQTDLAERQEELRSQLITRFARMNAGVGASKSTLSFLKNQIDAWNSKN
ncbi:flagellar filament capping protein FliD [Novosphingobium sp. TH158]|uniref:flagellar filament capping protein FliD n=1 Tax=Novosphingobium sp. TH158 TaxID=2067455 RepID=UPI000C7E640D|nr:flagellar filament capping protein FliD [Novosphingobium sp. TH158]PLK27624.1 flagellar hook protein [Novosphingobium sp. TH158]